MNPPSKALVPQFLEKMSHNSFQKAGVMDSLKAQ